jgi:hypothetical protein
MVKKNNAELVKEYLEHIKKKKSVSAGTIKTYENIGNNLPFSLLLSQSLIEKKLKELYTNPNTLQLYLNMIILIRRHLDHDNDKLIKLRNSLKDKIIEMRKENLDKLDDKLPSYDYIKKELDNLTGIRFILNYLILNHGLRNKDLNMVFVKSLPKDKFDNYILNKGKYILLDINDYKTQETHGNKQIKITDEKFIAEFKKLKLKDGFPLLPMKCGMRVTATSTFNDKIISLSIDKLGQNKLFKSKVKDLLNKKDFNTLEQLANDRGTSLGVILKSYNLHNGTEDDGNDGDDEADDGEK